MKKNISHLLNSQIKSTLPLLLLVAVPLAILGYLSLNRVLDEQKATQKELLGVRYHVMLYKTLLDAERLRDITYLNSGTKQEMAALQQHVKELQPNMDLVDKEQVTAKELNVQAEWLAVKQALQQGFATETGLTGSEKFLQQTKTIGLLQQLIFNTVRNATLLLDPEEQSYRAATLTTNTIPAITSLLGYWRGNMAGLTSNDKFLDSNERVHLIEAKGSLESLRSDYLATYRLLGYTQIKDEAQPQEIQALDKQIAIYQRVIDGASISEPEQFFKTATVTIEKLHGAYQTHQTQLNKLLRQRLEANSRNLMWLMGMVILTALACVSFIIISRNAFKRQLETANQLKSVFDTVIDAMIVINDRGIIQSVNPATTKMFGFAPKEMLGKNISMLMPAPYKAEHDGYLKNYHETHKAKVIGIGREVVGQRKDGSIFEMELAVSETSIDDKRMFVGTVRDVSDRVKAANALQQQKKQFEQLIANQSVATFMIDAEHRVLYWNAACEALTGVAADVVVGTTETWRGFYDKACPSLADMVLDKKVNQASRYYLSDKQSELSTEGWHGEAWFDLLGGKRRYVIFDAVPILNDKGEITAVVETLQDVTEGKLAEQTQQVAAQKEAENAQQIKAILNTVLDGLIVIDERGIIQIANPATTKIFGYGLEEMIGQNVKMLMPETEKRAHDDYLKNYRETGEAKIIGSGREVIGCRKDGTHFAMDLAISETIIDGKRMFVGTTRDISERRQMERLYRLMTESIEGYATLILDQKGFVKTWNEGAERLKGYTAEEIIGQSFALFYTLEEIEAKLPEKLLETCKLHGHAHIEGWRVRKDGTQFYADVVLNRLQEDDGSLLGFVKVTRDITLRRQMETELRQAYANLEEFTAVASHDLKSPIRGIADLAEWIKEDLGAELQESVKNNLDRIQIRIKRMETLIEDLLQYSRAGRVSAEVSVVDPLELVSEILEIQPLPEGFKVSVTGKSATFRTAKTPLQTSLRNLISNAIKHHDKAEGNINIHIKTEGNYCVFVVQDDGPGIPESAQGRVFKLFQTLSKNKESTGLGLAVSKRMIEAHGGRIELESSSEKRGCTFRIYWPRFSVAGAKSE